MAAKSTIQAALGCLLVCLLACDGTHLFAEDTITPGAATTLTSRLLLETTSASQSETSTVLPAGCAECSATDCGGVACDGECGEQCDGCSGDTCCDPCCRCRPCELWVRADYLLWTTRGVRLPPLVTTSPIGVVPPGAIGAPTTTVLFGDDWTNNEIRSGYRVTMGYWFRCCCRLGVEADYFDMGGQTAEYYAASTGDPVLARPIFDSVNQIQTSVAYMRRAARSSWGKELAAPNSGPDVPSGASTTKVW